MTYRLLLTGLLLAAGLNSASAQDTIKATTLPPAQEAEVSYNNGTTKFNNKQYADAIADFNKAIELKPDFEKAYYNRGLTRMELFQNKAAIEDFSKSIELNAGADYAYFSRGAAKEAEGNKDGAAEITRRLLY